MFLKGVYGVLFKVNVRTLWVFPIGITNYEAGLYGRG